MGFIVKKVISTFLLPLPIGILLFLTALFFLLKKKSDKSRIFLIAGLAWLSVFSYDPLANVLIYQIEHQYPTLHHPPSSARYIYVLGSGHTSDKRLPITSQVNKEAVVRLNEGIRLYRKLEGKAKLILSGYSGPFDPTPHAVIQRKLALALGIPAEDIIIYPEAKDTEEEAYAAKEISGGEPLVMVTSAYHMPRAVSWFEKAGLHPVPAPTYHQANLEYPNYLGIFSAPALLKSTIAFHEFLGVLWQKFKGA